MHLSSRGDDGCGRRGSCWLSWLGELSGGGGDGGGLGGSSSHGGRLGGLHLSLRLALVGGVLEGGNGGLLLNLRWVLVNLGGGGGLRLGLRLEEVADTRRQTTANLGSLGRLLVLLRVG